MLTKKQKEVWDFVDKYIREKGYAPSLEEIQKYFKLASVSTAHYYIDKLQKEGYIKKESNQPRSLSLQNDEFIKISKGLTGTEFISLPIFGSANCGDANIVAKENLEGYLRVAKNIVSKKEGVFILQADGDSMNKANIRGKSIDDGDFVLIDSEDKDVSNGDCVLSIIDGCANLKKFEVDQKTKQKKLVPESTNPKHMPIYLSSEDNFVINGKILAVVKK
ncbi:transcriptional repressor LexA [Candidatus Parcubacteria bacterium]|nr:transcriptional repressor LexA [Candidatus Parcubacteria bacterium]